MSYYRTKHGFLVKKYMNMRQRVEGIQRIKAHLYLGLPLLTKQAFYDWAESSREFHTLFAVWEANEYNRKLTPSVNRINSNKGYLINNIEWVTNSENSRLGRLSR